MDALVRCPDCGYETIWPLFDPMGDPEDIYPCPSCGRVHLVLDTVKDVQ